MRKSLGGVRTRFLQLISVTKTDLRGTFMDFDKIPEGHYDGEEPMVFHYRREERLKNAPKIVQDYYSGDFKVFRPGLLKALVSTRGNKLLFMSLVICFLVVIGNILLGPKQNSAVSAGIPLKLTSTAIEETIYSSLKVSAPEKKFKDIYNDGIMVSVHFKFLDADNQIVFDDKVSEKYTGKEIFLRTSHTDYDIFTVCAEVEMLDETLSLKSKVEKR